MRTKTQVVLCVFASLIAASAHAVQLGEIQGRFDLGNNFEAYIDVLTGSQETIDNARVSIAPDPTYYLHGGMSQVIADMQGELVEEASRSYIRLSTTRSVREPMLVFRVTLEMPRFTLSRSYSVLFERPPPEYAQRPRGPTPEVISSGGAPPERSWTEAYGPVQWGETLWVIARSIRAQTGDGMQSIMQQVVANNPQAFINGNMDRLKAGAMLVLPVAIAGPADKTGIAQPQAPPAPQPAESASPPPEPAVTAPPVQPDPMVAASPAAQPVNTSSSGVSAASAAAPPIMSEPAQVAPRPATDWRDLDPELAAELDRLAAKYALLRARYAEQQARKAQQATPPAAAVVPAPAATASAPTQPVATTDPAPAGSDAAFDTDQPIAAPVASAVDVPAAEASSSLTAGTSMVWLRWIVLAIGLTAIACIAIWYGRSQLHVRKSKAHEVRHQSMEAVRKREVAEKAAKRLELEDEVQSIIKKHEATKKMMRDAGVDEPKSAEQLADDLSEIDFSITHGRYKRAEMLLRDVVREAPRNVQAKLRLIEVFYMTEQSDDFIKVARDIREQHREDLDDADWQKVVRMGKIICPDDPLFGGLAPVKYGPRAS